MRYRQIVVISQSTDDVISQLAGRRDIAISDHEDIAIGDKKDIAIGDRRDELNCDSWEGFAICNVDGELRYRNYIREEGWVEIYTK